MPVRDQNGIGLLDRDEFIRGDSTLEGLGKLNASFEMMGQVGFDASALCKSWTGLTPGAYRAHES